MQQDFPPNADEGIADWDFICFEVPPFELNDDDDDDDDETTQKADEAPVGKLASLHPDHPWIVSARGWSLANRWLQEAMNREQGAFGLYFYKWFDSYGKHEVLENIVSYRPGKCSSSRGPSIADTRISSATSIRCATKTVLPIAKFGLRWRD